MSLTVSRPAQVRLYYRAIQPAWPVNSQPVLLRRAEQATEAVPGDVVWDRGHVEWQATPGTYELLPAKK